MLMRLFQSQMELPILQLFQALVRDLVQQVIPDGLEVSMASCTARVYEVHLS